MVKTGLRNTSCVLFIYRCSLYTPSGYFQGHDFFLVRKSSYRFLTIRSNHFESSLPAYSQVVPSIRDHHFHLFLISWMTLVQIANTFDMIYSSASFSLYTLVSDPCSSLSKTIPRNDHGGSASLLSVSVSTCVIPIWMFPWSMRSLPSISAPNQIVPRFMYVLITEPLYTAVQ